MENKITIVLHILWERVDDRTILLDPLSTPNIRHTKTFNYFPTHNLIDKKLC
jgi:hypothetical protein